VPWWNYLAAHGARPAAAGGRVADARQSARRVAGRRDRARFDAVQAAAIESVVTTSARSECGYACVMRTSIS
jgi:hypothetical protein